MNIKILLFIGVIILLSNSTRAQSNKNFYYIIKKSEIDNGNLDLIYRDKNGTEHPLHMCYPVLRAEDLSIKDGLVSFHFERIPDSEFDSIPNCISNRTQLGSFTIDLRKEKIGDRNQSIKIPFRTTGFGIAIIPYRIRFKVDSIPASTDSKLDLSLLYGITFGNAKINHERIIHDYITLSVFTGLTSESLKKGTVSAPDLLKKERDAIAFAYGINIMFGRNNFGLSLSLGFGINSNFSLLK